MAGLKGPSGAGPSARSELLLPQPMPQPSAHPPLTMTLQGKQVVDQVFDNLADIGPSLNTVGDEGFTPRLADSWRWALALLAAGPAFGIYHMFRLRSLPTASKMSGGNR